MTTPPCADVGAYLLGALEPSEANAFAAHLTDCLECQAEVADLAGLLPLLAATSVDTGLLDSGLLESVRPGPDSSNEQVRVLPEQQDRAAAETPRTAAPKNDVVPDVREPVSSAAQQEPFSTAAHWEPISTPAHRESVSAAAHREPVSDAAQQEPVSSSSNVVPLPRRRSRRALWLTVAAVLAILIAVPLALIRSDPKPLEVAFPASDGNSVRVQMIAADDGSDVTVWCHYEAAGRYDEDRPGSIHLWITTEDGSVVEAMSWPAMTGDLTIPGAVGISPEDVVTLELRDSSGTVLATAPVPA